MSKGRTQGLFAALLYLILVLHFSLFSAFPAAVRDPEFSDVLDSDRAENASLSAASPKPLHYHLTCYDDPGGSGRFAQDVYAEGSLVGKWASCGTETQLGTVEGRCLVDSVYNDRLVFSFSFSDKAWPFGLPKLEVRGGDAHPEVVSYSLGEANGRGSFTVMYNCRKPSKGVTRSFLVMKVPVTNNYELTLAWAKKCEGGPNKMIEFGYMVGDRPVKMSESGSLLEVSPVEMTSRIFFALKPDGYYQTFGKPMVESSDELVGLKIRGSAMGGFFSSEKETTMVVLYECKGHARANISLHVPIPPWDDTTIKWIKDCGGSLPKGLMIGTSLNFFDIVDQGRVQHSFTSQISTSKGSSARSELTTFSSKVKRLELYFKNRDVDGVSPLHFDDIVVTKSQPDLLFIQLKKPHTYGSSLWKLDPGESKKIVLRMVCLKSGSTVVTFTLPVLRYKNIEFSFLKRCTEASAHQERFYWWNVGAMEDLLLLIVAVVVVVFLLFKFKCCGRREPKYQLASSQER